MAGKLRETRDYSLFKVLDFNRDVRRLKKLEESMKTYGWLDPYPMHVVRDETGMLLIKGGNHRFTVARKLGIPVKFVVCEDGGVSIHELEKATNPWSVQDYLTSYVRCGYAPYIAVADYHKRTGIPLVSCISLLGGESATSSNKLEAFKRGTYKLGDMRNANVVAEVITYCVEQGINFATNNMFVGAVSRMTWLKEFDAEVFKRKVATHKYLMEKRPSLDAYTELIDDVYNRQSHTKVPLAFLAIQAARSRAAVKRPVRTPSPSVPDIHEEREARSLSARTNGSLH